MFNAVSSFHLGLLCALYLDFKYISDSKDLRHTFVKVAFLSSRTNICINLLISVVSLRARLVTLFVFSFLRNMCR